MRGVLGAPSSHSHTNLKQISPLLLELLPFSCLRAPFALLTAVLGCELISTSIPNPFAFLLPRTAFLKCTTHIFFPWMFVHRYFVLRMFVIFLWAVHPLICHLQKFVFILTSLMGYTWISLLQWESCASQSFVETVLISHWSCTDTQNCSNVFLPYGTQHLSPWSQDFPHAKTRANK